MCAFSKLGQDNLLPGYPISSRDSAFAAIENARLAPLSLLTSRRTILHWIQFYLVRAASVMDGLLGVYKGNSLFLP